jgi:hypothetical protein
MDEVDWALFECAIDLVEVRGRSSSSEMWLFNAVKNSVQILSR